MSEHRVVVVGQQGLVLARELLALGHVVRHVPSCRGLWAGLQCGAWEACILAVDQLTAHEANLVRCAREVQPELAVLLAGKDEPSTRALARLTGADDIVTPRHPRTAAHRIAEAVARRQARRQAAGQTPTPAVVTVSGTPDAVYDAMAKRDIAEFADRVTHEIDNPATYITANLTVVDRALSSLAWDLRGQRELSDDLDELNELVRESLTGMTRIASITRDLRTRARVGLAPERPNEDPEAAPWNGEATPEAPVAGAATGSSQTRRRILVEKPPSSEGAERLRLLVIDDEPLVLRSLRRMLSHHSVDIAAGGAEAMTKLMARRDYDLIFCDVMMPGMDGAAVCAAIAQRLPHLIDRIVLCSGGALTSRTRAFIEQSNYPLLRKPITLASFNEVSQRVMSCTAARRANGGA